MRVSSVMCLLSSRGTFRSARTNTVFPLKLPSGRSLIDILASDPLVAGLCTSLVPSSSGSCAVLLSCSVLPASARTVVRTLTACEAKEKFLVLETLRLLPASAEEEAREVRELCEVMVALVVAAATAARIAMVSIGVSFTACKQPLAAWVWECSRRSSPGDGGHKCAIDSTWWGVLRCTLARRNAWASEVTLSDAASGSGDRVASLWQCAWGTPEVRRSMALRVRAPNKQVLKRTLLARPPTSCRIPIYETWN